MSKMPSNEEVSMVTSLPVAINTLPMALPVILICHLGP